LTKGENSCIINGNRERIRYIDLLRTFTIFCVLWGHCTQNPVFAFIYSFHMPLFYLISGFFFKSSLKDNVRDFIFKKDIQLVLSYIVWCSLRGSFLLLNSVFIQHNNLGILQIIKIVFGGHFWFLRELFISYFMTYIGYKIFKNGFITFLLCICFTLFAPLMHTQSFYLPIFFIGIFCREYHTFIKRYTNIILLR
jgi:fucose 4-O-acetylase-like acetyltransferase